MGKMKELHYTELSDLKKEKLDLLKEINSYSLEIFNLQGKLSLLMVSIEIKQSYINSESKND